MKWDSKGQLNLKNIIGISCGMLFHNHILYMCNYILNCLDKKNQLRFCRDKYDYEEKFTLIENPC